MGIQKHLEMNDVKWKWIHVKHREAIWFSIYSKLRKTPRINLNKVSTFRCYYQFFFVQWYILRKLFQQCVEPTIVTRNLRSMEFPLLVFGRLLQFCIELLVLAWLVCMFVSVATVYVGSLRSMYSPGTVQFPLQ